MTQSDMPARPVIETGDIEFARVTRSTGEPETLRLDLYQPPAPHTPIDHMDKIIHAIDMFLEDVLGSPGE